MDLHYTYNGEERTAQVDEVNFVEYCRILNMQGGEQLLHFCDEILHHAEQYSVAEGSVIFAAWVGFLATVT